MLIEINDITAPELDVFARLTEAQLRSRLEPEKGAHANVQHHAAQHT